MPYSVYIYSNVCIIVETMVLGLCLMFIGNGKCRTSQWLRYSKRSISAILIISGLVKLVLQAFDLNTHHPMVNTAFNLILIYLSIIALSMVFIPLANQIHFTKRRMYITQLEFLICCIMAWTATMCDEYLFRILIIGSMALYFVELVRLLIVFFVNYQSMKRRARNPSQETALRLSYIRYLYGSIILLSIFAVLGIIVAMLPLAAKTLYNAGMVLVWIALFASFVNLIINYDTPIDDMIQNIGNEYIESISAHLTALRSKVDNWIEQEEYCRLGVTMIQLAEELETNRTYLSEYINSRYGCSFNLWLNRLRIDKAKQLLLSSPTLSIDKIALSVGYSSKSHFMHSFKSLEGTSPGQWRLRHL